MVAYDPCVEFLAEAPDHPYVVYAADDRAYLLAQPFDIVFVAMVLGSPEGGQETTMARLADLLAPGGLLVLLDHMPDEPPAGRWWYIATTAAIVAMSPGRCGGGVAAGRALRPPRSPPAGA